MANKNQLKNIVADGTVNLNYSPFNYNAAVSGAIRLTSSTNDGTAMGTNTMCIVILATGGYSMSGISASSTAGGAAIKRTYYVAKHP